MLLNSGISALEDIQNILLIGSNLRLEAPLLNVRLRKRYNLNPNTFKCYSIGFGLDYLTFPVFNVGNGLHNIYKFCEGKLS